MKGSDRMEDKKYTLGELKNKLIVYLMKKEVLEMQDVLLVKMLFED